MSQSQVEVEEVSQNPAATKKKVRKGKCGGYKCGCLVFKELLPSPVKITTQAYTYTYCTCKHSQDVHAVIDEK